jgi:hypothetical protein
MLPFDCTCILAMHVVYSLIDLMNVGCTYLTKCSTNINKTNYISTHITKHNTSHDITEIVLEVALSTIKQTNKLNTTNITTVSRRIPGYRLGYAY